MQAVLRLCKDVDCYIGKIYNDIRGDGIRSIKPLTALAEKYIIGFHESAIGQTKQSFSPMD